MMDKILIVVALEPEITGHSFTVPVLFTGVGKVNATYHLTRALTLDRPDLVLNLGTAGSNRFAKGAIILCTRFIQRDMDVSLLGFAAGETPFSDQPPVLEGTGFDGFAEGVCSTGDSFLGDHAGQSGDVFDMEAFALASVCPVRRCRLPALK